MFNEIYCGASQVRSICSQQLRRRHNNKTLNIVVSHLSLFSGARKEFTFPDAC